MQLSDFHYDIPDELIAATPPAVRGTSRLLVLDRQTGTITDRHYPDVVDYLQAGDVLVINDTKVIKARLITRKPSGGERELVLVEQHGAHDDWFRHKVIYRRKLIAGDILTIGDDTLMVEKIIGNGIALIRSERNLLDIAAEHGTVPLPPYLGRDATAADIERYQTVFARETGSVAAPTASLNMTESTLRQLRDKGVNIVYVTYYMSAWVLFCLFASMMSRSTKCIKNISRFQPPLSRLSNPPNNPAIALLLSVRQSRVP